MWPLRILAAVAGFRSIEVFLHTLLRARGLVKQEMRLAFLALLILPPLFLLGARFGGAGVAAGWAVGFPLAVAIPTFFTIRPIVSITVSQYLRTIWAATLGCIVMGSAVIAVRSLLPDDGGALPRLAIQSMVGAATYAAVISVISRHRIAALFRLMRSLRSSGSDNPDDPAASAA